jgi:hypothetical protein
MIKRADRDITKEHIDFMKGELGEEGIKFFRRVKKHKGVVSCVLTQDEAKAAHCSALPWPQKSRGVPHPIHFREGMWVRNRLRSSGLCEDWSDHELDDNWAKIVVEAISEES